MAFTDDRVRVDCQKYLLGGARLAAGATVFGEDRSRRYTSRARVLEPSIAIPAVYASSSCTPAMSASRGRIIAVNDVREAAYRHALASGIPRDRQPPILRRNFETPRRALAGRLQRYPGSQRALDSLSSGLIPHKSLQLPQGISKFIELRTDHDNISEIRPDLRRATSHSGHFSNIV